MQDDVLDTATHTGAASTTPLKQAVFRSSKASRQGVLERLFAFVFEGLVYPQIWEDPVVDMDAMAIEPGHHVVAITSGGCNVLSYLTADPARITAVDLNQAHLSLLKLKQAAIKHLLAHEDFARFFAGSGSPLNVELYDQLLAHRLDDEARHYWSGERTLAGPRIELFAGNFYRHGLLGRFISAAHLAARLHGVNPADIMASKTLDEQRWFFAEKLSPLFDKRLIRWLTSSPMSLYGLGIPPAQYTELAEGRHMADVLRERLGKLACDFPLSENYFARQAFGRSYASPPAGGQDGMALPPYLDAENWGALRDRIDRVSAHNRSVTDVLAEAQPQSVDRIVLLDAQDWMSNDQLNALWAAATRAAAPGARIIFRTAARTSPLEGRVAPSVLDRWAYGKAASRRHTARDRSAIYGGFHLYELRP
ncbi:DUF3419 family protein [Anderseniella sp. Alg231-50]|uniref:DUF3419 family protein n=1 Tax=Anderseniella sp. Alg231-50 TaxID=1922226 RepID=UPI000D562B7E